MTEQTWRRSDLNFKFRHTQCRNPHSTTQKKYDGEDYDDLESEKKQHLQRKRTPQQVYKIKQNTQT